MAKQWIGFELEGVLAEMDMQQPGLIGDPIYRTVNIAKDLLNDGQLVKVITPLAASASDTAKVKSWLSANGLAGAEVIASDPAMATLWSTRAVRVDFNSGKICKGCADTPVQKHSRSASQGGLLASTYGQADVRIVITDC